MSGTPWAYITPRNQQLTPIALPSLITERSSRAGPTPSALPVVSSLVTPAVAAQADMEEQCLSAGRWLRGLAEECLDKACTPVKPQSDNTSEELQVQPV